MSALVFLVNSAIGIFKLILIVWVITSWLVAFNVINTRNQFVASLMEFLYRVTEPALRPIRRIVPDLGGIDISPLILLLLVQAIQIFFNDSIVPLLYGY
ncbi:membrane protein [Iodidimonas muriae]|uniref:Membrane protein n=1 Tax=Iodidimonas muriae TaxID=261467 RepID=A0ABQ2LCH3_9PROT|nr:YggT family protein [Iodidimonas muriae]GER06120.1 membrane protein [Kordiimonadales bacterium JCM 17843]GGO08297.1 membrane protein [Iodidimonas muriae]